MSKTRTAGSSRARARPRRTTAKPLRGKAHQLRFVVIQEGEWVAAQCLEYDIATQARTLGDLVHEIQRTIVGHIATSRKLGKLPFEGVPRAPKKFWDMFRRSRIPLWVPKVDFDPSIRVEPTLRVAV
jgi:hypothetical protein